MTKSQKGSCFEREFCRILSLWWTEDQSSDVFWRTSGSGARAKTRSKKGLSTFGQYGDVQATDPIGQPLIDNVTIELKRGYSAHTAYNTLDKLSGAAEQEWEKWLGQAKQDSDNAGTPWYWLVTKRDRRQAIIFIPLHLFSSLDYYFNLKTTVEVLFSLKLNKSPEIVQAMRLDEFLGIISPNYFTEKGWEIQNG